MSESIPNIPNAIAHPNLLLGGAPTTEHLQAAIDQGYVSFVDLRNTGESGVDEARDLLAQFGVSYTHIPIAGSAGLTRDNAKALDTVLTYNSGPVMIFCASGNRVGALLALRAHWHLDATETEALQIGLDCGLTKLEAHVRRELGL